MFFHIFVMIDCIYNFAESHVLSEISQGVFSIARPEKARSLVENSEQPSPVSVLEAPFEDEDTTPQTTVSVKTDLQGRFL